MAGFVCKFGGSSVADADQIKKIEKIIKQDPRRRYIVLSAPGKRHPGDQKITDMLYQCQELAGRGQDITGTFAGIKQRYLDIAAELRVKDEIEGVLDEIQQNIQSGASRDYAASRGEYLCARMMARYLGAAFIESAKYIRLTSRGGVDQYTYGLLAEKIKGEGMYVIPGFYGGGPDGEVRTFSRGGSDITGAIVARAAGADLYENWTDVSGLLMTDPGIVEAPRPIPEATYREIRELGACGAKVLHEEAIVPLYDQGIPIAIKNTNQPGHPGTTIVETRDTKEAPVAGIAGSTGFRLLTAEKMLMGKEGYREKLLDLVNQSNIGPVQMSVGVDSVSIVASRDRLERSRKHLKEQIKKILSPDRLEISDDLAVVAVVGEGITSNPTAASRVFSVMEEQGIPVKYSVFSPDLSITLGVERKRYTDAIQALYRCFAE